MNNEINPAFLEFIINLIKTCPGDDYELKWVRNEDTTPVFDPDKCRFTLDSSPWIDVVAMDADGKWFGYGAYQNESRRWACTHVCLYRDTPSDKWRETKTRWPR